MDLLVLLVIVWLVLALAFHMLGGLVEWAGETWRAIQASRRGRGHTTDR